MSSFAALFVATNVIALASALECHECSDCPEPWDQENSVVSKCHSAEIGGGTDDEKDLLATVMPLDEGPTLTAAGGSADFVCRKKTMKAKAGSADASFGTVGHAFTSEVF